MVRRMTVSTKCCLLTHDGHSGRRRILSVNGNSTAIERIAMVKNLAVLMTIGFKPRMHCMKLAKRANRVLLQLQRAS